MAQTDIQTPAETLKWNVYDINIILKANVHHSITIIISIYLKTPQNKLFLTGYSLSFGLSYSDYFASHSSGSSKDEQCHYRQASKVNLS